MKFSRLIEWGGTKEDSDEPPLQDWVRELKDGQSKNIFLMDGKAGSTDEVIEKETEGMMTRKRKTI